MKTGKAVLGPIFNAYGSLVNALTRGPKDLHDIIKQVEDTLCLNHAQNDGFSYHCQYHYECKTSRSIGTLIQYLKILALQGHTKSDKRRTNLVYLHLYDHVNILCHANKIYVR